MTLRVSVDIQGWRQGLLYPIISSPAERKVAAVLYHAVSTSSGRSPRAANLLERERERESIGSDSLRIASQSLDIKGPLGLTTATEHRLNSYVSDQ